MVKVPEVMFPEVTVRRLFDYRGRSRSGSAPLIAISSPSCTMGELVSDVLLYGWEQKLNTSQCSRWFSKEAIPTQIALSCVDGLMSEKRYADYRKNLSDQLGHIFSDRYTAEAFSLLRSCFDGLHPQITAQIIHSCHDNDCVDLTFWLIMIAILDDKVNLLRKMPIRWIDRLSLAEKLRCPERYFRDILAELDSPTLPPIEKCRGFKILSEQETDLFQKRVWIAKALQSFRDMERLAGQRLTEQNHGDLKRELQALSKEISVILPDKRAESEIRHAPVPAALPPEHNEGQNAGAKRVRVVYPTITVNSLLSGIDADAGRFPVSALSRQEQVEWVVNDILQAEIPSTKLDDKQYQRWFRKDGAAKPGQLLGSVIQSLRSMEYWRSLTQRVDRLIAGSFGEADFRVCFQALDRAEPPLPEAVQLRILYAFLSGKKAEVLSWYLLAAVLDDRLKKAAYWHMTRLPDQQEQTDTERFLLTRRRLEQSFSPAEATAFVEWTEKRVYPLANDRQLALVVPRPQCICSQLEQSLPLFFAELLLFCAEKSLRHLNRDAALLQHWLIRAWEITECAKESENFWCHDRPDFAEVEPVAELYEVRIKACLNALGEVLPENLPDRPRLYRVQGTVAERNTPEFWGAPIFTSAADSLGSARENDSEDILCRTIIQILASGRALVFSLPQLCDNPVMLELLENPYFRTLLSTGLAAVSMYGSLQTPYDYLMNRLDTGKYNASSFLFSSSSLLNSADRGLAYRDALRQALDAGKPFHQIRGNFQEEDRERIERLYEQYRWLKDTVCSPAALQYYRQDNKARFYIQPDASELTLPRVINDRLMRLMADDAVNPIPGRMEFLQKIKWSNERVETEEITRSAYLDRLKLGHPFAAEFSEAERRLYEMLINLCYSRQIGSRISGQQLDQFDLDPFLRLAPNSSGCEYLPDIGVGYVWETYRQSRPSSMTMLDLQNISEFTRESRKIHLACERENNMESINVRKAECLGAGFSGEGFASAFGIKNAQGDGEFFTTDSNTAGQENTPLGSTEVQTR